jgi:hypothetical protein
MGAFLVVRLLANWPPCHVPRLSCSRLAHPEADPSFGTVSLSTPRSLLFSNLPSSVSSTCASDGLFTLALEVLCAPLLPNRDMCSKWEHSGSPERESWSLNTKQNPLEPPSPGLVGELRGKMHACGEPEWIGIEHRIVRVGKHLVHVRERGASAGVVRALRLGRVHRRGRLVRLRTRGHRGMHAAGGAEMRRRELGGIRAWPCGLVAGLLVEDIGLRIVLLLCTHGVNLGRTEFYV